MALTKQQKEAVVAKVTEAAANAESVVFVRFHGLNVTEQEEIRSGYRAHNVSMAVAKKTLIKRALDTLGIEGELPEMNGEVALIWGDEPTSAPSETYNFSKKFKEKFEIQGGIFENEYKNNVEMTEIAQIPSLDVLRGMFANVINSPIQRLVVGLDKIAQKRADETA